MQQAAAEHRRAAGGRAIGAAAEFREAQVAALMVLGVEVERDGELAVGGAGGDVVAVWEEKAPVGFCIPADQVALDVPGLPAHGPLEHGEDPALQAGAHRVHQALALDGHVVAALEPGVDSLIGAPVDIVGEAGGAGAALLIVADQLGAEFRLQDAGQDQHRGERTVLQGRRVAQLLGQAVQHGGGVLHRFGHGDAEGGVQEEDGGLEVLAVGDGVEAADRAVEVPEIAHARIGIGQAPVAAVQGVDRDAVEGRVSVVEQPAPGEDQVHRLFRGRLGQGAEHHQHDPAAGGHIEAVLVDAIGGGDEEGGGVANGEGPERSDGEHVMTHADSRVCPIIAIRRFVGVSSV